jgi:glycosyltransferase involved in cell wall biosynthesis
MKRRVLLIDLGANFGGVESYLVSLTRLLATEIDLYVLCVLPELKTRLANCGVQVILLPAFRGMWKPLRFLTAMIALPLLLLRYRIETVQLNGFLESILILPARALGRSAVYTRHGPFELELYSWSREPLKFLARRVARWCVRFTTHVVCVSEAVAESVRPLLPPARFSVIPNWVSGQQPFRSPAAHFSGGARVICVSRLEHYKGIQLLIAAAKRIPEIEVTVVGDGSDRGSLEALAHGLGNVRFAGFQQNIEEFYERADIFIMPSMGPEGLPITSLEAMAHGLPCIFSDLPVHREITDDGKGAYLFRSGDAESLITGIGELLASPGLRHQYASAAHGIVATRYNELNVRQAYLQVLSGTNPNEHSVGLRREDAPVNANLHPVAGE